MDFVAVGQFMLLTVSLLVVLWNPSVALYTSMSRQQKVTYIVFFVIWTWGMFFAGDKGPFAIKLLGDMRKTEDLMMGLALFFLWSFAMGMYFIGLLICWISDFAPLLLKRILDIIFGTKK